MTRILLSLAYIFFSTLAQAGESDQAVYLTCIPKSSWLSVGVPGHERNEFPEANLERISLKGLVTYSEEDAKGDVHRTGVKTTERGCGVFTVRITGAFFNANIQGELGAADDFALVEVHSNGKKIVGPIAMGECSSSIRRYSYVATCPDNWAVSVAVFELSSSSTERPVAYLKHIYEESRGP